MDSADINKVVCPVCSREVQERYINDHLDNGCKDSGPSDSTAQYGTFDLSSPSYAPSATKRANGASHDLPLASIFNMQGNISSHSHRNISPAVLQRNTESKRSSSSLDHIPAQSNKRLKSTTNLESAQPFAERLRPKTLEDFVGQAHLMGTNSLLMNLLNSDSNLGSIIFWGPPGCGKTTLARLLAKSSGATFKELSATDVGINQVRQVFEEAKRQLSLTGKKTILFLDEVHRFNRAQQDIFLPYVEQGHIQLIGATTENPSFKVNGALLSRCRVFILERLTDEDIEEIITRAIHRISPKDIVEGDEIQLAESASDVMFGGSSFSASDSTSAPVPSSQASSSTLPLSAHALFPAYPQITRQVLNSLISLSSGDARTALSLLSLALSSPPTIDTSALLSSLRRCVVVGYDRTGDDRYDLISALHKSVRGSNGNAALYWLARMLSGGEDPLYIARRMVVCASEDIGMADSHALPLAMATYQACQVIGMPECRINLAHLITYLAEAPKSTRAYMAYNRAEIAAKSDTTLPVPLQIRNAPTHLMKELGYSKGYKYNPDYAHPVHNQYLPDQFKNEKFLYEAGNLSDKIWNEEALKIWEKEVNEGKEWEGRNNQNN